MLINCSECQLRVSDKALSCPHCGFPLKQPSTAPKYQTSRRKRLPNGFGQISELKSQNLRKPYRAMVTIGKDSNGRPICRLLKPEAYFRTYKEAYEALLKYNSGPADYSSFITVQELYERWKEDKSQKVGLSVVRAYQTYWNYCDSIKNKIVQDVRVNDIRNLIENSGRRDKSGNIIRPTEQQKARIRQLMNMVFDYAVTYELLDRNPARVYSSATAVTVEAETHHKAFTSDEISILEQAAKTDRFAALVLIQCYSGWRPGEMCNLKLEDVNINDWTFTGGMKTKAGIGRIVPIHSKIRSYVDEQLQEAVSGKYKSFTGYSYRNYLYKFHELLTDLNLDTTHQPHDPRKTFVTMAKAASVDEYAIKYLVGHTIKDLTERVYTERSINWLRNELEKIS